MLAWLLTVESALALGAALVAAAAWRGLAGLGADEFHAVTHPLALLAAALLGALAALAVAARARR